MDFTRSEEQQALASTVRALLDRGADDLWQVLCEQIGVAALAVPEEHDGVGASLLESMVVLEELGRSLEPSPMLASVVAAEALLAGGTEAARTELLPRIAAGEVAAFGLPGEPTLSADRATILLSVAGDALVHLPPPSPSSDVDVLPAMDLGSTFATFDGAGGVPIGDGNAARARAALVGAAGVAALSVGLAERALEMTVAYSKERVQFGRPIGSFQALKHRMADLLVLVEMARSASWAASYALATDRADAERLVHVAKSYCSDALSQVAAETVQLHGGIAITWEHDAQRVFKRAHALGQLYGAPHRHRALIEL